MTAHLISSRADVPARSATRLPAFVVQADSHHPAAAQAAHVARRSPARVLRECKAKRAIIAEFLRRDALGDLPGRSLVEDTLKAISAV